MLRTFVIIVEHSTDRKRIKLKRVNTSSLTVAPICFYLEIVIHCHCYSFMDFEHVLTSFYLCILNKNPLRKALKISQIHAIIRKFWEILCREQPLFS